VGWRVSRIRAALAWPALCCGGRDNLRMHLPVPHELLYRMGAMAGLLLAACSPALDWREVRPAGSGAQLLMPCKPNLVVRGVQLAGHTMQLAMSSCDADGQTWALAFADVRDPAAVNSVLAALQSSGASNLAVAQTQVLPLGVPGATPYASSRRVRWSGHLPDGRAVQAQQAVFARGTVVFQAMVLGPTVHADGSQNFFTSIRLVP
jgi:hypothetical protein